MRRYCVSLLFARELCAIPIRGQGLQESLRGMFHGLPRMFAARLVIPRAVMDRGSQMRVRRQIV